MKHDYTGQRFGRLVVQGRAGDDGYGHATWRSICDCGGEKVCVGAALRSGRTQSCGCLLTESRSRNGVANRTHGLTHTPIWRMWQSMLRRCNDPNDKDYPNYGGRGIAVCQAWQESFESFLADMGPRPAGFQIERQDNDGGYEPGNCVWADVFTQANNRRTNRRFTHNGRDLTVSQWAREAGLEVGTVFRRLERGWAFERSISEPLKKNGAG